MLDNSCERLLPCFHPIVLRRILTVQLQRSKGNIAKAVSNSMKKVKEIEAGIEALYEHERLMDPAFFEHLIKGDWFMVKGRHKKHRGYIQWIRYGFSCSDARYIKLGSPQAHAFIRYVILQRCLDFFILASICQAGACSVQVPPEAFNLISKRKLNRSVFNLAPETDPDRASDF